jgi:limonene 1,2-monooxygenase
MEHLHDAGYDEAWIGEHRSGGWELVPSPELFIAAAAERTKHLRFGTGMVTVPYHHPFMVAERITFLDHLTRGSVMLGVGAGALPSDVHMIWLDPMASRGNLESGLESLVALLRAEGLVSTCPHYTRPHVEVAVASTVSPTGAKLSGLYDTSLLSLGLWSPAGAEMVRKSWQIRAETAGESSQAADRSRWRIVGLAYLARTEREAREECRDNLGSVFDYLAKSSPFPPCRRQTPMTSSTSSTKAASR